MFWSALGSVPLGYSGRGVEDVVVPEPEQVLTGGSAEFPLHARPEFPKPRKIVGRSVLTLQPFQIEVRGFITDPIGAAVQEVPQNFDAENVLTLLLISN